MFFVVFFLESMNFSWRPPLEICIAHACELLRLMACSSIGASGFTSVDDLFHEQDENQEQQQH